MGTCYRCHSDVEPIISAQWFVKMAPLAKEMCIRDRLCTPRQAIGTEVYNAKFYLEIPTLFAWTAVVVALSLTMEWLLAAAVRRWKGGASHAGH